MKVRLDKKGRSLNISGAGISGIFLLLIIFVGPYFLALPDEPTPAQAEQLIRLHLKKQASQHYAKQYQEGEITPAASYRFKKDLTRIEAMTFDSVKVGRLFPDYYLYRDVPSYFAKGVIRDDNGRVQKKVFSLGSGNYVIAERPRYVWFLVM